MTIIHCILESNKYTNPILPYFARGWCCLANVIVDFGLLSNNTTTIIGAMIVAPLINPIVTLSYIVIAVERRLLEQATLTLVILYQFTK